MEKATFDPKISRDENFELILKNADAADPQLAKVFRSIMPLLMTPSSDAERKAARAMFHDLGKADLDKILSKDAE